MPRALPLGLLLIALLSAACGTSAASRDSAGGIIPVAISPQSAAPALAAVRGQILAGWIGSDDRGVHQDARWIAPQPGTAPVTLPLPPINPFDQTLWPGSDGRAYLLWLDRTQTGETRLFAALLSPDLGIERGPVIVSEASTGGYAAQVAAGTLWAAWTEGDGWAQRMMISAIDALGRPRPPVEIESDASFPALAAAPDGTLFAFWQQDGGLYRARLIDGVLLDSQRLTGVPALNSGDRLQGMRAGLDAATGYVFWNITRANGTAETWLAAGGRGDAYWPQPRKLLDANGQALTWASPAGIEQPRLPVALQRGEALALAHFAGGDLIDVRELAANQPLMAAPTLISGPDGLVVGWSAARMNQPAALQAMIIPEG